MNLLQYEALNASPDWHRPFHLAGTGGMSSSLKLGDSGQIPDSDGVIRMNILLFSFFPPLKYICMMYRIIRQLMTKLWNFKDPYQYQVGI